MADEQLRSLVSFEMRGEEALKALEKLWQYLDKIEASASRASVAFDSVVEKTGDIGYLRVRGMDELLQKTDAVISAITRIRTVAAGPAGAAGGLQQMGVAAVSSASQIVILETELAKLQQQASRSQRQLDRLGGISLAGLFETTQEGRRVFASLGEGYEVTTDQMTGLSRNLVTALAMVEGSVADLSGTAGVNKMKMEESLAGLADYWASVNSGERQVRGLEDAFKYLGGMVAVWTRVGGMADEETRALVGTMQQYAAALINLQQAQEQSGTTEELLSVTRKAHAETMDAEMNAATRLAQGVEALNAAIAKEAQQRGAAVPKTEAAADADQKLAEANLLIQQQVQQVILKLQQQISTLQALSRAQGQATSQSQAMAGAQHSVATATQAATAAAAAQAAAVGGAGVPGAPPIIPTAPPVTPGQPGQPYVIPPGTSRKYMELVEHLQNLQQHVERTGTAYNTAGQQLAQYNMIATQTGETLGRLTDVYDQNSRLLERRYNYIVQDTQGNEVRVQVIQKLIGAMTALGEIETKLPAAVPATWLPTIETGGLEAVLQLIRANTEATDRHTVSVQRNGNVVAKYNLTLRDTGATIGTLTTTTNEQGEELNRLYNVTMVTGEAEEARAQIMTQVVDGQERVMRQEKQRTGILRGLASQFQVHFRWMLRYMILWKGLQLIQGVVRSWFEANMELHYSLGLLRGTVGDNVMVLRDYESAMYSAGRAARTAAADMSQAVTMVGRIYEPEQAEAMMRMAGQLALLGEAKVEDTTRALIVLQRQLGLSSEEMAGVLDALAGSMEHTHLTYADMLPMLKRAGAYTDRYNMTIKETIGLQAGIAAATGASSSEMDAFMRGVARIYDPSQEAYRVLTNMRIAVVQVGKAGELVHRPLIDILRDVAAQIGDDEARAQAFSEAMFRAGSVNRVIAEGVVRDWSLVERSVDDAADSAGAWDKRWQEASESWKIAIAGLSGAWRDFLTSLKLDPEFIEQINTLAAALGWLADRTRESQHAWDDLREATEDQPLAAAGMETYKAIMGVMGPAFQYVAPRLHARMMRAAGLLPEPERVREPEPGRRLPMGAEPWTRAAQQLGRALPFALSVQTTTLETPEGVSFAQVAQKYDEVVNRWLQVYVDREGKSYQIGQKQIDDARQMVLVWDEATQQFRLMNAYLPALNTAISELDETMQSAALRFVQFDPRMAGGLGPQFQRLLGYYERLGRRAGLDLGEARPQVLWGPEDQFERMIASDMVLQLAMHGLTDAIEENTKVQTEGMWNIPGGQAVWVPITSLFYQQLQPPTGGRQERDWGAAMERVLARMEKIFGPMAMGPPGAALTAPAGAPAGVGGMLGAYMQAVGATRIGEYGEPLMDAGVDLSKSADDLTRAGHTLEAASKTVADQEIALARSDISFMQATVDFAMFNVESPYVPTYQRGGMVTRPTLALLGETEPELVIPISKLQGLMTSPPRYGGEQQVTIPIILKLDGKTLAQYTQTVMMEVI